MKTKLLIFWYLYKLSKKTKKKLFSILIDAEVITKLYNYNTKDETILRKLKDYYAMGSWEMEKDFDTSDIVELERGITIENLEVVEDDTNVTITEIVEGVKQNAEQKE